MKRLGIVFLLLFSICLSNTVNAAIIETFDEGLNGWAGNPDEVTWADTNGNSDGFALFTDGSGSNTLFQAPEEFLGNWSSVGSEGYISFDHKIFDIGNNVVGFVPYTILITGTAGTAYWEGETPAGATDWTTITAYIGDDNWTLSDGAFWDDLLSDVTGVSIGIEAVDNRSGLGEITGIDNIEVSAVPIPSAALLLVTGLLGIVGLRRKMIR